MAESLYPARIAGLLLAAGGGRRLGGQPKALLSHRGRPLVEHAVRTLRAGGCGPVLVVLGAQADTVQEKADLGGCPLVVNPDWQQGMGCSLRAGLRAAAALESPPDGLLVALTDQPGIGPEAVARVLHAFTSPASLVMASYEGRRDHPVLIGSEHWKGVAATAAGDQGARRYLREHSGRITLVECADVADPADIDTPEDLVRLD
ncbi:nucleotidyltransferase family protein [Streptomyces sp. XM4193]|uniref:nucleotidyltransferase family protein n=1 Tax=Streptomyces sp. XM4193 TaxID=2929782 RepID=UPI001FF853E2|nr:nucleotidyltransferase family protein [Streptomyces sp. XM4193]MCK1797174.1 nucleotidyltransferase family protein [Streptomyces sp. XM4193]